jgi:hypothetical protein
MHRENQQRSLRRTAPDRFRQLDAFMEGNQTSTMATLDGAVSTISSAFSAEAASPQTSSFSC